MKNQALLPSKDKSKKLKCRLLHFFVWRFTMTSTMSAASSNFSQVFKYLRCMDIYFNADTNPFLF